MVGSPEGINASNSAETKKRTAMCIARLRHTCAGAPSSKMVDNKVGELVKEQLIYFQVDLPSVFCSTPTTFRSDDDVLTTLRTAAAGKREPCPHCHQLPAIAIENFESLKVLAGNGEAPGKVVFDFANGGVQKPDKT